MKSWGDVSSMKINAVQNYSYAPNYKGSFFKEGAFKELENSLTGSEKETFNKIIISIENTKDNHNWWFDTPSIRNGRLKLAVIGKLNEDGTPQKPGYFLDEAKNSLELFQKLAAWYKKNVEGYKG